MIQMKDNILKTVVIILSCFSLAMVLVFERLIYVLAKIKEMTIGSNTVRMKRQRENKI